MKPTVEQLAQAEILRENAGESIRRSRESFERCDTDGFVSQHCSDLMSRLYRTQAEILENGGYSQFTGLYEGERRVKAKMCNGQYGWFWLLDRSETDLIARRGKPFLPTGKGSRVLKALGLVEADEEAPAWANTAGGGYGFSGLGNVYISVYRTGDDFGTDAIRL